MRSQWQAKKNKSRKATAKSKHSKSTEHVCAYTKRNIFVVFAAYTKKK